MHNSTHEKVRKSKARAHDEHPNKMLQQHLNDDTLKAISSNHTLHSMLLKGSIKVEITTDPQNSGIKGVNCNRRALAKFIKTV